MSEFTVGQHVRVVNAMLPTFATVTGFDGDYVLAKLDKGGPEYRYRRDQLADESDATPFMLDGDALSENRQPTPKVTQLRPAQKDQTPTWKCLECGKTYHGNQCPRCGSDERIYNV